MSKTGRTLIIVVGLFFTPTIVFFIASGPSVHAQDSRQLDQGLVGYWNFDEGQGTVLYDNSGHGNDGTIAGGPTWPVGVCGNAMSFDGIDDFVQVANSGSLNFGENPFSFTFWIKIDTEPTGWTQILAKRVSDGHDYEIQFEDGGRLNYIIGDPNTGYTRAFSSKVLDLHKFYMVTVVRSGGQVALYLNDSLDTTDVSTQNVSSSSDLFFGRDPSFGEFVIATLDEVRIYDRALSLSEIGKLYSKPACFANLKISDDDISFSDPDPNDGTGIEIAAKVHNTGGIEAKDVEVVFYDGSNEIGNIQVIPNIMGRGGVQEVKASWTAAPSGVHTIRVEADRSNSINETDETDNIGSKSISVFPQKRPDLSITTGDIVFPTWPVVLNTNVNITVTVHNDGKANASDVLVRFLDGGTPIAADLKISSILSGGSAVATMKWLATPKGEHTITVTADPDNLIEETSETNNAASRTITLALPPSADLTLVSDDIFFGSSPPVDNSSIEVFAIIHNIGDALAIGVTVRFFDGAVQIGPDAQIPSLASLGGLTQVSSIWKASPAGNHTIRVRIDPDDYIDESNEMNNEAFRQINISINQSNVNHPPVFTSEPVLTATAGIEYVYDAKAFDEDGDNLTFSLTNSASGMKLDQKSGRVTWTPIVSQKGQYSIAITVSDGKGGAADQPYLLSVLVKPPSCTIGEPVQDQIVKGEITLKGTAEKGALDVKSVQFRVDGGPWRTANGTSSWNYRIDTNALNNGRHTIEAKALDQQMESNITSAKFVVNNPPLMPPKKYRTYTAAFPWLALALILSSVCMAAMIDTWAHKKERTGRGPQD